MRRPRLMAAITPRLPEHDPAGWYILPGDGSVVVRPQWQAGIDDGFAITSAFNWAQVARLIPAVPYQIASPVVIPPMRSLICDAQSLAYYGGSIPMPLGGAVLTPTAAFTGATYGGQAVNGALVLLSQNLGGYGIGSGNHTIRGITVDGRSAPAGVNGLEAWGPVWGLKLRDCGFFGLPQYGVYTSQSTPDGTAKAPDLWNISRVHIAACGSDGLNTGTGGLSDSYFTDSESTANTGSGWNVTGDNQRWTGCKAEFNRAYGWRIIAGGVSGQGNHGVWLTGCSTDYNYQDGILVYGSAGAGPVMLANCVLHADGYQGGSGGGGYAGLRTSSPNARILAANLAVLTKSGATPFPQYGVRQDANSPSAIVVASGLIYGNTAATFINAGATGTITTGADVLAGTGAWS